MKRFGAESNFCGGAYIYDRPPGASLGRTPDDYIKLLLGCQACVKLLTYQCTPLLLFVDWRGCYGLSVRF